jgi:predicted dehydrogenase
MGYRLAVVGGGKIAESHLMAASRMEQLQLAAIADVQPLRAEALAAHYNMKAYTDYQMMIEREKPDIAVITLPHHLHKEAAVYCLENGAHVLLEKPMALTAAECDEIIDAARLHSRAVLVGHTQHYMAENRKAKELIDSGVLGQLVMVNDTRHLSYFSDDRPGWFFEKAKSGGGIIANLGSHSIDKIQWLSGGAITKVRANLSYHGARGDVEGSGIMFLENEHGVPATVTQSGYIGAPRNETELIFTHGMLRLNTGQGLWLSEGGEYRRVNTGEQQDPFRLQFLDLLQTMETNREPQCSMTYSRSIVHVLEHIYRSAQSGEQLDVEHAK